MVEEVGCNVRDDENWTCHDGMVTVLELPELIKDLLKIPAEGASEEQQEYSMIRSPASQRWSQTRFFEVLVTCIYYPTTTSYRNKKK